MTWQNVDVFAVPVPRGNVRMSLLFEALEAARWRGLTDREYDALTVEEKARLIAHYRTVMRIEAVQAWENLRDMKRAQRQRRRS